MYAPAGKWRWRLSAACSRRSCGDNGDSDQANEGSDESGSPRTKVDCAKVGGIDLAVSTVVIDRMIAHGRSIAKHENLAW